MNMKNSLALVITEEDVNHIQNLYGNKSLISEATIPAELKGEEGVRKFQNWLNSTDLLGGGKKLKPDNNFGPKTSAAWNTYKDKYLQYLNGVTDVFYVVDATQPSGYKKVANMDELKPYIEADRNVFVYSPTATQGAWKKASEVTQLASIITTLPPVVPPPPGAKSTETAPADLDTADKIKKFKDYVISLGGNITFSDPTNQFTQDVKNAWDQYGQGFLYSIKGSERESELKKQFPNIISMSQYADSNAVGEYGKSGVSGGTSGVSGVNGDGTQQ